MSKIRFLIAAAALSASYTPSMAANLLVNGDFEASSSTTATPPGWTNIGHTEGVISYAQFGTPAFDGKYYYDIGGFGGSTPAIGDGITQSVATTAGQAYTLSFGYTGENTAGVTTVLNVLIGSQLSSFTIVGNGLGLFKNPFTLASINYTATGASTAIAFTIASSSQIGFNDPLIDGVVFEAATAGAVPEPGTWSLMIAGFGIAGMALRRRQRVSVSFG